MATSFVRLAFDEDVAWLTLDRPARLNALTPEMGHQMMAALDDAIERGARALVLTGEGRAFCAGADIGEGSDVATLEDFGAPLEESYNALILKLADYPLPIVTAINGPAVGAGCALALMGDMVLAARSSYLLLSFVKVGLVPDCGATWLAVHTAGVQRALEAMMLGEKIDAEKAHDWGMINRVVTDEDLSDAARDIAGRFAKGPTIAYGMIRRAARNAAHGTLVDTLMLERQNQRRAGTTEDAREAIAAFAEKRVPAFRGR